MDSAPNGLPQADVEWLKEDEIRQICHASGWYSMLTEVLACNACRKAAKDSEEHAIGRFLYTTLLTQYTKPGKITKHPPQDAPGDPVISLFQVHKTHVDWLGKLPTSLKHPSKGKEVIRGSMTGAKPALFLLEQRFNYQSHPGIDFPREAEECDPPIVGTHPLVPTLKNRDHHPSLPVQGHCPRCPRNVAEACQPGQPYNIQSLKIKQQGKKEGVVTAQEQLLKMQLDEARKNLNDK
ncbi:hypothetical protein D4764_15G0008710 [Takifugu flavidus]|uniref:Uncharacterized protein n=1 Tax=Takifugu flavidus TaxID=433684 RepID=A0A5C6P5P1_9TELE|nr:hypothetical protein D4764_15G0008710 [Takifugu flavidus]